jgi:L-2,4-diaminobutyric acid acetyltransferase
MESTKAKGFTTLRRPCVDDGPKIWRLVKEVTKLDLNSGYCYLVLCSHFADTSVVAERGCDLVGFVTAYRPPLIEDVLFVWQIGVVAPFQGQGVGLAMLLELLGRDICRGVSYVETTIMHSNLASKALFASLQKRLKAPCIESLFFSEDLFPEQHHPGEYLLRIGPFDLSQLK